MPSPMDESLLKGCMSRCAGLMSDLKSVPQLHDFHSQIKTLRSSLRKMNKASHHSEFDSFDSDPTMHPGLSLLAVYLFNLRNICGYYGINYKTTWRLDGEQRDFALTREHNPFGRLGEKLVCVAQQLKSILTDKGADDQERERNLCEWAESMIEHWDFFKGELIAARGHAAAASATSESRSSYPATTVPHSSANLCNCKMADYVDVEESKVWDSIHHELAAEGIGDDTITKVTNDLKAYVRDLVRGQRPKVASQELEPTSHSVNTSEIMVIEELSEFRVLPKDLLDCEAISSKVTAALDRIHADFDQVANEVLTVALQQDDGDDTKPFRQVLDLIYHAACRDTTHCKVLAKLAKRIQDNTTTRIRDLLISKKRAKRVAEGGSINGPVTNWFTSRCGEAWARGKNGRNRLSIENFAFGLPTFMGELLKSGVFKDYHIQIYVRSKWNSTMERDQFVALYQLLRTTGRMCEGKQTRAFFENIPSLIENKDTPSCVKALARELNNLRESGWNSKESEAIDEVHAEMRTVSDP